jgi:hypothetical protein
MMAAGGLAAAQRTQNQGRGQDSMLVHMTPGEVGGLQALAMKHGGSLSINPSTGLPEAGFLSKILPLVAGLALGPAGFGLSAGMAGLTVGGLTGLATGSLSKGLMAGLGAYGGAGIGGGLVNAATPLEAASTQVSQVPTSAFEMAQSNIDPSILESGVGAGSKDAIMQQAVQSPAYQQALASPQLVGSPALDAMSPTNIAQAQVLPGQAISTTPAVMPQGYDAATSGLENLFKTGQPGTLARSQFMAALPTGTLPATGATVASAMAPEPAELETQDSFIRPFSLEIDNTSGQDPYTSGSTQERRQLRYRYTPQPIYKAAEGGEVPTAEISPEAASVYAAIARTQQAAGLPTIDTSQYSVRERAPAPITRNVFNTAEKNYSVYQPVPEDSETFKRPINPFGGFFGFGSGAGGPSNIIGYTAQGEPIYETNPTGGYANFNSDGGGGMKAGGLSELAKQRKSLSGNKRYKFAADRRDSSMEASVDQNLARGGVAQPRFLSGGGDGMSDSIKANIDGVQEARLADGEFVVPADVVSHLGNGSSKAGAKKLYAMMDKIRKARTGKTKQAPEVKAERLMPA